MLYVLLTTEIKSGFQLFDKNGDNRISRDELVTVLRSLGNNPSEEEISDMITEADIDGIWIFQIKILH